MRFSPCGHGVTGDGSGRQRTAPAVPEGGTTMSVDITESTSLERAHAAAGPLGRAALAALRAPALLDSQPWRWRLRGHVGELWADHAAAGPEHPGNSAPRDDRLVMLCCGIALHHVTTALPALGRRAEVTRLPDPARADLAAVLWLTGRHRPTPDETRAYQAMLGRRLIPAAIIPDAAALLRAPEPTTYAAGPPTGPGRNGDPAGALGPGGSVVAVRPISGEVLMALRRAAEEGGAHLHLPRAGWHGRPAAGSVGVPAAGTDDALLCANTDAPAGWLAAGEALSAVLILAAQRGVTVRPLPPSGSAPLPLPTGRGRPMLAIRLTGAVHR
jgi:hypothetical protein